jgi:hypothetical protein
MKWLLPTNLFWVIGHILMVIVGIFLTVIALDSSYRDVWLGVGGSLIASGVAGEILYLYVSSSQETKDRLDLISKAGLLRIFSTRSVRIREEYHSRLRDAKEVDVLGFGLSSFREDYGDKFAELSLRTSFRILLLDPNFPSQRNSVATIRDREEGNNQDQIKNDVEAFENVVRRSKNLVKQKFQVKRLSALPSINVFRVDDEIFWGPYLVSQQSRNMPTLLVRKGGFLYDQIKAHFDCLWENDQFSKPMQDNEN